MRPNDKALDELRDIYRDEFDREITRDEAAELGTRLITLVRLLLRPLPKEPCERQSLDL